MLTVKVNRLAVDLDIHYADIAIFDNQLILCFKGFLFFGLQHTGKNLLAVSCNLRPAGAGSLHLHDNLV